MKTMPREPRFYTALRRRARQLLPDTDFNKGLQAELERIQSLLHDTRESTYLPHVVVEAKHRYTSESQGLILLVASGFPNASGKYAILEVLGATCYRENLLPLAIYVSSESWLSHDLRYNARGGLWPRHDPNRREVLVVMGGTVDGRMNGALFEIDRASQQEPLRLAEVSVLPYEEGAETTIHESALIDAFYRGYLFAAAERVARQN
jgi:hypothetical protein